MKVLKVLGWSLFAVWAASTAWELYDRQPGDSISLIGQMFINFGAPYFVFFLILLWFMKRTGLHRLPRILDLLESRYGNPDPKPVGEREEGST